MALKSFLVAGLGSMGKRRVRNLQALGFTDILGFEARAERRKEVAQTLRIKVINSLEEASGIDALVISTPPDAHESFIEWSIKKRKPCFVELDILLGNLRKLSTMAEMQAVFISPSTTFLFHPAIMHLAQIVKNKSLGEITGFSYHSGQYLPDWHPWESVKDFFVGKPETSGCMELLAFELHWIAVLLGIPEDITVLSRQNLKLGLKSDDNFAVGLGYPHFAGSLTVDVISRFATRNLIVNFQNGQVRWNWEEPWLRVYDSETKAWEKHEFTRTQAHNGYNENLSEAMYVDELHAFIVAAQGGAPFPTTMKTNLQVLGLIRSIAAQSHHAEPKRKVRT